MKSLLILATFLLFFLTGCAPKVQITLLPEENGKVGVISLSDNKGKEYTINQAYEVLEVSPKNEIEQKQDTESNIQAKYAEVLKALPPKHQSFLLYFGFDKATLEEKQIEGLKEIAALIKKGNIAEVMCIGHSDSAGDKEYNKILSLQRAKNVAKALIADFVNQSLITIEYYGDADPLVPTTNNKPNAQNRRVEIILK
ncbi:MAG: OmpA family protein [Sulfurospirillaceae bacterium]|nr:OmpA family protein [Sulfurospirillaceae bacterium]